MSLQGKRVLWHVSAHGWGHAARQRELIRAVKAEYPHILITLVSSAPAWFWQGIPVDWVLPGRLSPIALEKNGVPDGALTAANLRKFLGTEKELLSEELRLQRETDADLVVTDIDPLPVKAADINSIPAIGVGNFTWDWILAEMCPDLRGETERIAQMYSTGIYLRLPMGPDHSPFETTAEMPLLRGGPEGHPDKVKSLLPVDGLKCLVAFRHLPESFPVDVPDGLTAFTALPEPQNPSWLNITHGELARNDASFADLVAAADVVIAKPGYGIVSQLLAMGKPAVLIPLHSFPEENYLLMAVKNREATAETPLSCVRSVFSTAEKKAGEQAPKPVTSPGISSIVKIIHKSLN